jgi:hypothetical protein
MSKCKRNCQCHKAAPAGWNWNDEFGVTFGGLKSAQAEAWADGYQKALEVHLREIHLEIEKFKALNANKEAPQWATELSNKYLAGYESAFRLLLLADKAPNPWPATEQEYLEEARG